MFKNIKQVWAAIDAGKTVCWVNDSYILTVEDNNAEMQNWRERNGFQRIPFSGRGDKTLRVTCAANYFGSLLQESELSNLYIKESANG